MKRQNVLIIFFLFFFTSIGFTDIENKKNFTPLKGMFEIKLYQKNESDSLQSNIIDFKGKVKEYSEIGYIFRESFGETKKNFISKIIYKFDSNGYLTDILPEQKKDNKHFKNIYNKNLNIIEKIKYDSNGKLVGKKKYKYNSLNRNTQQEIYKSDGSLLSKYVFNYDNDEKIINYIIYNTGGELNYKYFINYSENGLITNIDGKNFIDDEFFIQYEFDDKGYLIYQKDNINRDKAIMINSKEIKYDDYGNITEIIETHDSFIRKIIFKNDKIGNPINEKQYLIIEKFGERKEELDFERDFSYKYYK